MQTPFLDLVDTKKLEVLTSLRLTLSHFLNLPLAGIKVAKSYDTV
jgi:hypothetical protein